MASPGWVASWWEPEQSATSDEHGIPAHDATIPYDPARAGR